jgi:ATP-binding cassette subfamily B protein
MSDPSALGDRPHSSRQRYGQFVEYYRLHRLDELNEDQRRLASPDADAAAAPPEAKRKNRAERRRYVREYLRWLLPHRQAVGGFMLLALAVAGLQMIEPLFLRNIVDKVLLNKTLNYTARIARLNLTGAVFVGVIIASNLVGAWKDYRQRLLNTRVMLSLRRALFDRLLNLPLPQLWDMKTGGILSRLTGDVDTTTGLLQTAIVSPLLSIVRLIVAIGILMNLNWRLARTRTNSS